MDHLVYYHCQNKYPHIAEMVVVIRIFIIDLQVISCLLRRYIIVSRHMTQYHDAFKLNDEGKISRLQTQFIFPNLKTVLHTEIISNCVYWYQWKYGVNTHYSFLNKSCSNICNTNTLLFVVDKTRIETVFLCLL